MTGLGCSVTALIGAFCAVQPDAWRDTVSAMAPMALAGELATEQAQAWQASIGSTQVGLLDILRPPGSTNARAATATRGRSVTSALRLTANEQLHRWLRLVTRQPSGPELQSVLMLLGVVTIASAIGSRPRR